MCGNISNYTTSSFAIKLVFALLLWILIIIDSIKKKYDLRTLFSIKYSRNIYLLTGGFLALFLITLTWSKSIPFGTNKILSFATGIVPIIFAFKYILDTMNKTRISIFYFSIIAASILFVVLIVILKPFNYNGNYIISATKWSHVIYAHFALISYLILLLTILFIKNNFYISIGLLASLIGIYISGLRAGMLGAVIFTIPIIIIFLLDKTRTKKNLFYTAVIVLTAITFCYFYSTTEKTVVNRIDNLAGYKNLKFNRDETLLTRLDGFRIAYEMFKDHPVGGAGFGGFKNYKGTWFSNSHKYPHNIFLEFLSETGLFGLVLFLAFLIYMLKNLQKISPFLTIMFLTGLWYALFSKDIPSQSLLFLFIAFTSISSDRTKAIKLIFIK